MYYTNEGHAPDWQTFPVSLMEPVNIHSQEKTVWIEV